MKKLLQQIKDFCLRHFDFLWFFYWDDNIDSWEAWLEQKRNNKKNKKS